MNLHSIVAPYVAAVNPLLQLVVRVSVGATQAASGRRTPSYATPGAFVGAIDDGAGDAGTVLTVSSVSGGVLQPGQAIGGASDGTTITGQVSGKVGGPGVYRVSKPQLLASGPLTTSLTLPAQVQPLTMRDLAQLEGLNLNGEKKAVYFNGDIQGVIRVELKGGDLVTFPDGQVYLVVQNLEGWVPSAGWSKVAVVQQDGS